MKILIRFPDNDFSGVLRLFGELIRRNHHKGYSHNIELQEDLKGKLVEWFNDVAPTLADMLGCTSTKKDLLALYLRIAPKDVYINEEVDEKMETYGSWGNADSVLIDFDAPAETTPFCLGFVTIL